jgi:hypothetical protein
MRFLAEVPLTEQRKKIIQEKLEELEGQSLSGSLPDMVTKIEERFKRTCRDRVSFGSGRKSAS